MSRLNSILLGVSSCAGSCPKAVWPVDVWSQATKPIARNAFTRNGIGRSQRVAEPMECDAMNHLRLEIDQVDEMTELY